MIRRHRRVVPATIVALVLLAACVAVGVSCVQVLLGQSPWIPFGALGAAAATFTWADAPVIAAGGVLLALGLVLLLAAVLPGRPTVLPLANRAGSSATSWSDLDGPVAGATTRSVRRAVVAAAVAVDGVDRASVALSGRTLTATVHTPFHATPELTEQVRGAVTARLADIDLARPLRVRVRTDAARSN